MAPATGSQRQLAAGPGNLEGGRRVPSGRSRGRDQLRVPGVRRERRRWGGRAERSGVRRFVFGSSSSVYGANPVLPKHEDLAPRPVSPYAASKLATETSTLAHGHAYGMHTLAFRFFNVFGPGQRADAIRQRVERASLCAYRAALEPIWYRDKGPLPPEVAQKMRPLARWMAKTSRMIIPLQN